MADEEESLSGAEVVGGAVVTIKGDIDDLEAKEKQAKAIAERIDGTTATLKFRADDSEFQRIIGSADRLTAGGKGLVLVPRIDEAAVLRASQALLDKVRDQWAGLVIVPRVEPPRASGLPSFPTGGTFPPTNAAGGAPLPSGGYGPGGVFVPTPGGGGHPAPAALPYYPAAPRTHVPREFTRRGVEQSLVGAYHAQGGGFTAFDEQRLQEAAGAGDPWTFHRELPAEVKEFLERPDLKRNRKLRNLFRVSENAGRGGGADAMGDLGQDEYFRLAEIVGGSDVGAALAHARASDDPDLRYLAELHGNLPRSATAGQARRLRRKADAAADPARRRQLLERADRLHQRAADEADELESLPATRLEAGHTFTAFGRAHRVERNEDDELRLTNDDGLDVPVAGLRRVVADAGSLTRRAEWDGSADPFGFDEGGGGGNAPPAAAAPPPPPRRPGRVRPNDDAERSRLARANARLQEIHQDRLSASARGVTDARNREAEIAAFQPRTGVEDAVGRAVDDLFDPAPDRDRKAADRVAAPREYGPRLPGGQFTSAARDRDDDRAFTAFRAARREQDVVGRLRSRVPEAERAGFDQQVEDRVGQGAGRVQAAREVEQQYQRSAAAAKRAADADEKAMAAAEQRAAAAQDRAERERAADAAQQNRDGRRLSAAELEHRLVHAEPEERHGILREATAAAPEGSLERIELETRAERLRQQGEGGGGARRGPLSFAGLARRVGGGVLMYEGLRLASDAQQAGEQMTLAGNDPRAQLKAQQGIIQSVEGIPLVGQIAGADRGGCDRAGLDGKGHAGLGGRPGGGDRAGGPVA